MNMDTKTAFERLSCQKSTETASAPWMLLVLGPGASTGSLKLPMCLIVKAIIATTLLCVAGGTVLAAGPAGQPGVSLDALARAAASTPATAASGQPGSKQTP